VLVRVLISHHTCETKTSRTSTNTNTEKWNTPEMKYIVMFHPPIPLDGALALSIFMLLLLHSYVILQVMSSRFLREERHHASFAYLTSTEKKNHFLRGRVLYIDSEKSIGHYTYRW